VKSLPAFFALLFLFLATPAQAKVTGKSVAISAVKTHIGDCPSCSFFALSAKEVSFSAPQIKQHSLYLVSTMDRIPSPLWWVAIADNGKVLLLEATERAGWNELVRTENISLKTEIQILDYINLFLELAASRSRFIDELTPREERRVQKKLRKTVTPKLRIVRVKGRIRLQFFARAVNDELQWWDLLIEKGGPIIKSSIRRF